MAWRLVSENQDAFFRSILIFQTSRGHDGTCGDVAELGTENR